MKINKKLSLIAIGLLTLALNSDASETIPKHSFKSNSQVSYNETPKSVDDFSKIFSEGMFYSRLRSNTFYLDVKNGDSTHSDHMASALGGSLVYKSATFADFDFSAGLYLSQAFFWDEHDSIGNLKKAKDVINRFNYTNYGDTHMAVIGQAYLRYSGIVDTKVSLGRQLVETFYTKSNDTKMIPNTFDGLVVDTKATPSTSIKMAYLLKQKLRDHSQTHSVLMYGDNGSTSADKPQWSQNDDSAMHVGLKYSALKAAGKPTDAPLIVADIKNKSIKNLALDASFYSVPELVSQAMFEANYKIDLDGFSVTPGMRYIKQFDNGAGSVGGASLKGNLAGKTGENGGYKDAASLDSQMIAARVVTKVDNYKINLGYANVLDESDLVTPWRGFPTAGYTRSMARYNWRANTQGYRLEVVRNANKKGIYKDIFTQASILFTDFDESKGGKDEMYYYVGVVQNVPSLVELQWRLRLGYTQHIDTKYTGFDNLDARFEVNYLF